MPTAPPVRLAVILGTVREGRLGPRVADWFLGRVREHGGFEADLVDLAEAKLPTVLQGPAEDGGYASPEVRAYAGRIARADAFAVVVPEYNRSYPAALKNALDSVYVEWQAKPVGFVSYGGGITGGLRAVEQLRSVFAELHTVTIRDGVSFPQVHSRFGGSGEPVDMQDADAAAKKLLDQLMWWAEALREARARRPYAA